MSRPGVSVVMPFAGDGAAAEAAAGALRSIEVTPEDELILVDNAGTASAASRGAPAVRVLPAPGEPSPAHARNVGAAAAGRDWILFVDADCVPSPNLLAAYFRSPIAEHVGAVAGGVRPGAPTRGLVSRYGATRSFLDQAAHLAHPYRPRAAAANLLVRREAFEQLGGFFEGVRAAEDTDFTWRLQEEGWRLELRSEASVTHAYRTSLAELRRQWRGYAAGRAWLARRYEDFHPQPALARALRLGGRRSAHGGAGATADGGSAGAPGGAARLPGGAAFLALDAVLALDELIGFALSNRPAGPRRAAGARVVLLADAFPAHDDPLVELAGALDGARVEAVRRPIRLARAATERLTVDYLEDDGVAARAAGLLILALRHPLRCGVDLVWHRRGEPPLRALAPGVRRLEQERGARLLGLGVRGPRTTAARIARLAGRRLDELEGAPPGRSRGRRRRD